MYVVHENKLIRIYKIIKILVFLFIAYIVVCLVIHRKWINTRLYS